MNGFDWFSGVAGIALPCPPALAAPEGPGRFFDAPNASEWGTAVPRVLIHECLHAWQLAGSRWLLAMVAEEWERIDAWQPGTPPPPPGALRHAYGRPAPGEVFSVRDLAECLARFWDVHIRGPSRLLAEEGDDLGGLVARIDARRATEGHGGYASLEFDALMTEGREHAAYAAPYRWLLEQALQAPAVGTLPPPPDRAASWAANLILPIAGFVALNAADPVPAFTAAVARLLAPDAVGVAATRRHPAYPVINLDWLICWPVLAPGVVRALRREGHDIRIDTGALDLPGIAGHPVWCHLRDRFDALRRGIAAFALAPFDPGPAAGPMEVAVPMEQRLYVQDPWAVLALPGQPNCRALLGAAFSPPLIRFADAQIAAPGAAPWYAAWNIDDDALRAAVAGVEARAGALRLTASAARWGLPAGAFGGN